MADNLTLNAGTGGATLAADDIAGTHHQRVKIQHGADGSATDVSTASPLPVGGPAAENAAAAGSPLLAGGRYDATPRTLGDADVGAIALDADGAVQVSDGGNTLTVDGTVAVSGTVTVAGAVTNAGTFAVQDAAAEASLSVIDDWDESDRAKVNPIVGQAGIAAGAGAVGVTVPRVTLASDDPAVVALQVLDNAISGSEMQVDVVGALPAGTNAIGKLAANSGVDIGDVDVTSVAAGANLIGDVGISGARTSGGTTIFRSLDLDETEEEVKATAGQLYWIHAMNLAATKRYLKVYNATAANVTVGTTTPVLTFVLATPADTNGAGFVFSVPNGIAFGTAITVAATTGLADNDTGAPGANEVVVNLGFA